MTTVDRKHHNGNGRTSLQRGPLTHGKGVMFP
jgi:hypothetical protein